MGPPLGIGGPEECVPLPVSFSHRRVGSSILASLSEAGGNESRRVTSKPLPPRSSPLSIRHVERTHAAPYARPPPMLQSLPNHFNPLIKKTLLKYGARGDQSKFVLQFRFGTNPNLNRERPCFPLVNIPLLIFPVPSCSLLRSSRTRVTKISALRPYRFCAPPFAQSPHAASAGSPPKPTSAALCCDCSVHLPAQRLAIFPLRRHPASSSTAKLPRLLLPLLARGSPLSLRETLRPPTLRRKTQDREVRQAALPTPRTEP